MIALLPYTRLSIPALQLDVNIIAVTDLWQLPGGGTSWDLATIGDQVGWLDPAGYPLAGPGNIVLAGHYTIPPGGQSGPFHELHRLSYGDFIYVMRPDGTTVGYRVIQTGIVDDHDMSVVWDYGDQRLTLIGCPGTDYEHRRVVVADSPSKVTCTQPGGAVVPCF
jgi:LPXTG-site transpeptidase (sortase) family protein